MRFWSKSDPDEEWTEDETPKSQSAQQPVPQQKPGWMSGSDTIKPVNVDDVDDDPDNEGWLSALRRGK